MPLRALSVSETEANQARRAKLSPRVPLAPRRFYTPFLALTDPCSINHFGGVNLMYFRLA